MAIGHLASEPGVGAITTHMNDCKDCDFRLALVPPPTLPTDSTPVYAARFSYPRFVGDARGPTFASDAVDRAIFEWQESQPIGSIKASEKAYAYLDGVYGIMNSRGLSIGESTCAARFVSRPVFDGGQALFEVSELTRIALQRCSTARDAILLMGSLSERYGFYGSEWTGAYAQGEAGEALTVADSKETWIFHILPDDTGKGAIWVAQRVPADHVSVVANSFSIGLVDVDDSENFLASANLHAIAIAHGLWDPHGEKPFHFALVYGSKMYFESYCARRVWRVYSLLSPSLNLSSTALVHELPFAIKPDKRISLQQIFDIQRDHYEGSEYDLTRGPAAGPFGNPNRYDRGSAPMSLLFQGSFERPIAMFRTAYATIAQSRPDMPEEIGSRLLFASASPHGAAFAPYYPASLELPRAVSTGSLYKLTRESMWWAATAVANYCELMWRPISVDIRAAQLSAESSSLSAASAVEAAALALWAAGERQAAIGKITKFQLENAESLNDRWWSLFDVLLTRYHDGYRFVNGSVAESIFYPLDWIKRTNFFNEKQTNTLTQQIDDPINAAAFTPAIPPRAFSFHVSFPLLCLLGSLIVVAGIHKGRKSTQEFQYKNIDNETEIMSDSESFLLSR